mmetsp:Transcript_50110/g.98089  ORF Transcript_50110/g.98089 Transcript_50110/m.98089 type:complete len:194 (-) Transcript_50110:21-602(-)
MLRASPTPVESFPSRSTTSYISPPVAQKIAQHKSISLVPPLIITPILPEPQIIPRPPCQLRRSCQTERSRRYRDRHSKNKLSLSSSLSWPPPSFSPPLDLATAKTKNTPHMDADAPSFVPPPASSNPSTQPPSAPPVSVLKNSKIPALAIITPPVAINSPTFLRNHASINNSSTRAPPPPSTPSPVPTIPPDF